MLKKSRETNSLGTVVFVVGVALFAASASWLLWTGDTGVRYSADHDETVPMWARWIPALVGIALVRLVPAKAPPSAPSAPSGRALRLQAGTLMALALVFALSLRSAGGGEPAHTLFKLSMLLGVPVAMFWVMRPGRPIPAARDGATPWQRVAPAIPVGTWLLLSYYGPLAIPPGDDVSIDSLGLLLATIAVGFLLNALLEEVFYRRWLQSRWEVLLGRRPAIVLTSALWASWHIGIQGSGALHVDLAHVFVNQGVLGLFLGYMWSKYRAMWPILVVHGAVNALPLLLPA